MWCTQCKTAFDYTTGKISTGPIHNPHFYDFVRQNGGDALQGQLQDMENDNCGAMPDYWTVNNKFPYNSLPNVYPQKYDDSYNYLMYSHRGFMDLSQVRIPALTGRFTAEDNGDLGARYLMKEISKEEMQKELIARETKRNKQLAVREVLEMVANVGIIIYRRIVADNFKNSDVVQGIVKAMAYGKELEELRKYANKSLLKIGMNKGFAVPMLNSYFEYIPARAISFWTGLSAQGDKAKYKNLW